MSKKMYSDECRKVQRSQIFKHNWIILIRSRVIVFFLIYGLCGPHIIPIIPTSSLSSPHCPCNPHVTPVVPTLSLWSPCHSHLVSMVPTSSPPPIYLPYPPPPPGGTPRISKNSIRLGTNWDISILFKDLKSVETHTPIAGCMVWWVDGWVNRWGHVKSLNIE